LVVALIGALVILNDLFDAPAVRWRRILFGGLYVIVGVGYAISYGTWKDAEQSLRLEPYLTLALGIAVWASLATLWLKPFGA
jgi:hypothetical protein